ncbi:MAG: PqqD family protein [Pyrinomonadaceae bacterium]|nr:PqqD family protein [Pyrinomonadaceae bacterium]
MARFENMVVQELKDETLVCDLTNNHVFCLNQTAGEIWKLCNGETSVDEIERILSRKFGSKVGQEMILLTLDELSRQYLLAEKFSSDKISRREMIRKAGLVSMMALPLVSSLVIPNSSQAASSGLSGFGGPCTFDSDCQTNLGCSAGGTCLRINGQFCTTNGECKFNFCTDSVCCDTSCGGLCFKCNAPGSVGTCTPVPNGQDPDNECPSGVGLAGVCNGAGACR